MEYRNPKNSQSGLELGVEFPTHKKVMEAIHLVKELDLTHDSFVRAVLEALAQNPEDRSLWDEFMEYIRPHWIRNDVQPIMFKCPPQGTFNGRLFLGTTDDNVRILVNPDDWVRGGFVTGNIGGGKTNFLHIVAVQQVMLGKIIWWFDTLKKDGICLSQAMPDKIIRFRLDTDFRFNPFEPTAGRTDKRKNAIEVVEVFSRENHLLEGSKGYLLDKVMQTIEAFEAANNPDPITFADVSETIEADDHRRGRSAEYNDVCRYRVKMALYNVRKCLSCVKGFDILKLARTSFVLDMTGIVLEVQMFIISMLIITLARTKMALKQITNRLYIEIFMDEFHRLLQRGNDFNSTEGESTLSVLMNSVREYGIGVCAATQSPSMISEASVRTQSEFKLIVGNLGSNSDYNDMADIMGLNQDQLEWVKMHGKVGRAILKMATGPFCEPFLLNVPYLNLKRI